MKTYKCRLLPPYTKSLYYKTLKRNLVEASMMAERNPGKFVTVYPVHAAMIGTHRSAYCAPPRAFDDLFEALAEAGATGNVLIYADGEVCRVEIEE